MATNSYAQLQQEIAKLQVEAEQIRVTEVAGVVERIKEAITHYELTPQDLFGRGVAPLTKTRKGASGSATSQVKYADGQGGEWGGRGPRPLWLRDAIAAGRALEEFAVDTVKPQAAASTKSEALARKGPRSARVSYKGPGDGQDMDRVRPSAGVAQEGTGGRSNA